MCERARGNRGGTIGAAPEVLAAHLRLERRHALAQRRRVKDNPPAASAARGWLRGAAGSTRWGLGSPWRPRYQRDGSEERRIATGVRAGGHALRCRATPLAWPRQCGHRLPCRWPHPSPFRGCCCWGVPFAVPWLLLLGWTHHLSGTPISPPTHGVGLTYLLESPPTCAPPRSSARPSASSISCAPGHGH